MVYFELVEVHVEGLEPIMCDGLKVTDKTAVTKVRHGGSHNAIDYVFGDHDIDFELTKPKDHASLYEAVRLCREEHKRYTILVMQRSTENAKAVPTHALYDCIFHDSGIDFEGGKENAPTISGSALSGKRLKTEYA
jgi:hypothetical protein